MDYWFLGKFICLYVLFLCDVFFGVFVWLIILIVFDCYRVIVWGVFLKCGFIVFKFVCWMVVCVWLLFFLVIFLLLYFVMEFIDYKFVYDVVECFLKWLNNEEGYKMK